MDRVLKEELGPLYVGLRSLRDTYFGGVAGLEAASEAVFKKYVEGSNPPSGSAGWREWPADAKEKDVLAWFGDLIPKLEAFAENCLTPQGTLRCHQEASFPVVSRVKKEGGVWGQSAFYKESFEPAIKGSWFG